VVPRPPHFPIWRLSHHEDQKDTPYLCPTPSHIMTTALEEALNDAISSGRFIDTKIVLFTRRDIAGRIRKPKALYANGHVLESVPYFKDCEFSLHSSAVHDNSSSQYYPERLLRQRLGTFLRPTTTSLRRTMAILQIVTSKRILISRILSPPRQPQTAPTSLQLQPWEPLVRKRFPTANTKRVH